MIIERLTTGDFMVNSYVLVCEKTRQAAVVDAGQEARPILEAVERHGAELVAILQTHGHMDHIEAAGDIREARPEVKIYIHPADAEMLTNPAKNLSGSLPGYPQVTTPPADVTVEDGDVVEFGEQKLIVLHTPGHSPGSVSYMREADNAIPHAVVFDGDLIFSDSIGRTDFPGSSEAELARSAREKILTLPGDTVLYPGHMGETTVDDAAHRNQVLRWLLDLHS